MNKKGQTVVGQIIFSIVMVVFGLVFISTSGNDSTHLILYIGLILVIVGIIVLGLTVKKLIK